MIKIRQMKTEDIEAVYNYGTSESRFCFYEDKRFWTEEQLRSWIQDGNDVLLVAEKGSKVIGYFMSCLHKPTKKATIENLYVDKKYRREGIATSLLKKGLEQLKNRGVEDIVALIEEDNVSIKELLKNYGFNKGPEFIWMYSS